MVTGMDSVSGCSLPGMLRGRHIRQAILHPQATSEGGGHRSCNNHWLLVVYEAELILLGRSTDRTEMNKGRNRRG
jgi:hypothetical protein